MSIKAYVGRMGSGKTYEVVTSVILSALSRGRRVISNIAGLDYDEFCTVLIEDGISADKIGKLVQVSHDDVMRADFWMTDKDNASERVSGLVDSKTGETFHCIIPGDLVALDENWRFWEGFGGKGMPDRVMNFYRMHRHFTHPETGIACDVALISQDVMDFSRKVRAVIEETYYMEKLTAVGSSKRYRVDVHQGGKMTRKPLRQLPIRTYDPRYFPLYSSHSLKQEGDADANEENIDNRGNILHSPIFRIGLPVALVIFLFSGYSLYRFFSPPVPKVNQASIVPVVSPGVLIPSSSTLPSKPSVVEDWRVVGWYRPGQAMVAVLESPTGKLRMIMNPPIFKLSPAGLEIELPEGGFATSWTSFRKSGGVL